MSVLPLKLNVGVSYVKVVLFLLVSEIVDSNRLPQKAKRGRRRGSSPHRKHRHEVQDSQERDEQVVKLLIGVSVHSYRRMTSIFPDFRHSLDVGKFINTARRMRIACYS